MKKVLITGSKGFVGRNLIEKLSQYNCFSISEFDTDNDISELEEKVIKSDIIIHLAGVNRPKNKDEFANVNTGLTKQIINIINDNNLHPKIILSSSTQAVLDNPYGKSKREAEDILIEQSKVYGMYIKIFRFPGLFGKYCRPNYNSVVATFCYNISHDIPIQVSNPENVITLAYIDDVCSAIINEMKNISEELYPDINPKYDIKLGELVNVLTSFKNGKADNNMDVFNNKLYHTYRYYVTAQF
ncbi:MAG: NAD-dependent epimerase/dehydratase family protein [Melioribacteraceae bacterium]|nr:NAD-dependent epimerase/dehydratase family protein [Melioribacteraceae bacterium]